MIVPIGQGAGPSPMFGDVAGGTDETNQLAALATLHSEGRLQPQVAEPAPQSHKSIGQQVKGKVG